MRTQTFRLQYQRLADDPEQPRGHHRPSVSITSCPLTLSGQTPACPLATNLLWPVSFPPRSLAPSSSSSSQTTSSFFIVAAENHSSCRLCGQTQNIYCWETKVCTLQSRARLLLRSFDWFLCNGPVYSTYLEARTCQPRSSPGSRSTRLCQTSGVANLCIKVSFGIMMGPSHVVKVTVVNRHILTHTIIFP